MTKKTTPPPSLDVSAQTCATSHKRCGIVCWGVMGALFFISGSAFFWVPKIFPALENSHPQPLVSGVDTGQMATDIAVLKEALAKIPTASSAPVNLTGVWRYVDLKLKVESGLPFLAELKECAAAVHQEIPENILEVAHLGRPTLKFLYQTFLEALSQESLQGDTSPTKGETQCHWWDTTIARLQSFLAGLVRVKVTPEGVNHLPPAVQKHLREIQIGQLEEALRFAQGREALKEWGVHAKAYVDVQNFLNQVRSSMEAS